VQNLSEPNPRDGRVTDQLNSYKGLAARWQKWPAVTAACATIADALLDLVEEAVTQ
jgi:hypothetical protein